MRAYGMSLLLIAAIGLNGCAIQFRQAGPQAAVSSDDSYIVLGVSTRTRLSVFKGDSSAGAWDCKGGFNVANVWSEDNFIVLKLKPRVGPDDYGIGQILPEGLGGRSFVVRKGASVPTFHAYPGKVTFVGGIQFFERDNRFGIAPDPSVTLDAVRSFLARKYPLFPHHLQIDYLKIVPAAGGC